jgi:ribose transport system ATP-binding protein
MSAVLLELENVSKRFTGTLALDAVNFELRTGEVHALLGENGAGKSTLIKILAGVYRSDQGSVGLKGHPVDPAASKLPISFIHQDLGLVDTMTVAENVAVAAGYPRRAGIIDWAAVRERAVAALERMGGGIDPDARVGDLGAAEKSIVAIGRAMAVPCDILVLDEPTAALPERDVARLLDALRKLRSAGIGIIYVTHRLDEVFRIADRATVLRDGRWVATVAVPETTPAALVHYIVGRPLTELFSKPAGAGGRVTLGVRDLTVAHAGPVSFSVAAGEITGLVGLRGAGHEVVGRAIFGDAAITGGTVELEGRRISSRRPARSIRSGIGFVSSKRGEESLARTLSVRENIFLNPAMIGTSVLSLMRPARERARCLGLLRRFSVRPPDTEGLVASLSGGNQQKVVVARWMEANCRLLVLEEPTIGVDVGSKAEIYHLLQQAVRNGLAVLLISSDFEEVAGICNRALIFDRGQVSAELSGSDITIARLIAQASGGEERMIQARLT